MLILRTLERHGKLHGFELAESIERATSDLLRVEEGSLYPALQRMLIKGLITGVWGHTGENRRARYYSLTAAGRRHLAERVAEYHAVSAAIAAILKPA